MVLILGFGSLCVDECSFAGTFEWEPFQTDPSLLPLPNLDKLFPLLPEIEFKDFDRYQFSLNGNSDTKSSQDRSEGLELDLRRFKLSLSRYVLSPDRDHTIRQTDLEKEREKMIQSFPSALQRSSMQDKFETIGKIFEPKVNLSIEF